jgi:uncharacterized protein (DUF885 family)
MENTAPLFNAWLEDFFAAYYRRRPVNATFIGEHAYDHALPDFTEQGVGDTLGEMETLLRRLQTLPPETLTSAERLDRSLAEGFLRIQGWEYRSNHFQGGNPSTYTGEAIFGVLSLFLSPFAPLSERVEAATARLEAVPAFLQQAQKNLKRAHPAWTARAVRECHGAQAFLDEGVQWLVQEEGIQNTGFQTAVAHAAAAFDRFQEYLERELSQDPNLEVACGAEAFDLLIRWGHFIDLDAEEIAAYASQELETARAYLLEHAKDFEAVDPAAALAQLSDLHPNAAGYLPRFEELWQAARAASEDHALLTWPDFPIHYMPQPRWARRAAPSLYFLFYRAPAAFHRPPAHAYLVTPIEADLPVEEQEQLLRLNNDSVIKLNHVVHHGSIGHHVQNWNAYRAASRIGQIAAVDCASRIAMFCAGTMAEGWAVYATDLMAEIGFLTPLEAYAEYQSRCRMSARAVVDVRLHQGRFNLEQAAGFYQEQAGMSPAAAQGEAVKNSMFPGAAMMYLVGCDRIHRLRRTLETRQGGRFDLRQFHDRFLSFGSVPVELAAREMEREIEHA